MGAGRKKDTHDTHDTRDKKDKHDTTGEPLPKRRKVSKSLEPSVPLKFVPEVY